MSGRDFDCCAAENVILLDERAAALHAEALRLDVVASELAEAANTALVTYRRANARRAKAWNDYLDAADRAHRAARDVPEIQ
jgi:flagellar basal body rod protein FlgC